MYQRTVAAISVLSRLLAAVMTAIVIACAVIFTIPALLGIEIYIVTSDSMAPAIRTGAAAFVDTCLQPEHPGQIIAFRSEEEEKVILHRISGITDRGWVTKGDANNTDDRDIVVPEAVIGTCLFSVPRAGFILAGMRGEKMMIAAGIVIVLNILAGLSRELP